uniref:Intermediate conductance calcium-activated potassium channel-helix bundle, copper, MEMBRANE PROTEIN n=1 Tax=Myoviridae sp. ct1ba2 TaxID=2827654 RepID=A0A8S5S6I7_9CAUD|nr:MAG TPA: Intermediate conductance calcium-activated potassium channel-helix bundle, copper, MEMBRANE PROTEIN [Myoviridae sp. ct1ba2]
MKQNLNITINGTNFRPGNKLGIGFELESGNREVYLSGSICTDIEKGQQAFFNQTAHLLVLEELAKVLTEDNGEKGSIAVTEVKSELEAQIKEKDERITALEKQVTELLLMFTNEETETTETAETTETTETHA